MSTTNYWKGCSNHAVIYHEGVTVTEIAPPGNLNLTFIQYSLYTTHSWLCTCTYVNMSSPGCAGALCGLCITPTEFEARLGEFSHYCPVSLARNELVDCSHELSFQYSAEFRYIRTSSVCWYMYIGSY